MKQAPAKATVCIEGATGPNSMAVNGYYEATTELSGDMAVYVKVDDDNVW